MVLVRVTNFPSFFAELFFFLYYYALHNKINEGKNARRMSKRDAGQIGQQNRKEVAAVVQETNWRADWNLDPEIWPACNAV